MAPGEVLGIDREPAMIEQARALAKEQGMTNVRFEVGRAEELPAADESYDAAIEFTLLEHVADPLRVLQEMRRVLRLGGVIGLADGDWGTWLVEPRIPALVEALALYERVWRHNGGNPRFGRHQRAVLRQAGFQYGPTMLYALEYPPAADDTIATTPGPAYQRAIELGWADWPTIERYTEGFRTWGKHPDALWLAPIVQTIGWRA